MGSNPTPSASSHDRARLSRRARSVPASRRSLRQPGSRRTPGPIAPARARARGRRKISSSVISTTIHPAARRRRNRSASRRRSLRLEWKVSLWTSTTTFRRRSAKSTRPIQPSSSPRSTCRSKGTSPARSQDLLEAALELRSGRLVALGAGGGEAAQHGPAGRPTGLGQIGDDGVERLQRHDPSTQQVVAEVLELGGTKPQRQIEEGPGRCGDRDVVDDGHVRRIETQGAVDDPEVGAAPVRSTAGEDVHRLQLPARDVPERHRRGQRHSGVGCVEHRGHHALVRCLRRPDDAQHPRREPLETSASHGMSDRTPRHAHFGELTSRHDPVLSGRQLFSTSRDPPWFESQPRGYDSAPRWLDPARPNVPKRATGAWGHTARGSIQHAPTCPNEPLGWEGAAAGVVGGR